MRRPACSVSADELAAAVDAVWHDAGCLHPVLGWTRRRVEFFGLCGADPRLGWVGGKLRVRLDRGELDRAGGSTRWGERTLFLARRTPAPGRSRAAADPMSREAWEAFVRRLAALHPSTPDPAALALFRLGPRFTRAELVARWRQLAREHHPDLGGSAACFVAARDAFERLSPFAVEASP